MTNSWCSNTARDEAVRAAEDGRLGPLPTLEECIERQKQSQAARPGGGTDPAPSGGEPGGAATGLQTHRVVLEITIDADQIPTEWPWDSIMRSLVHAHKGESVRVVEEEDAFAPAPAIAGGTVLVSAQHMGTLADFLRHTTRLTQESGVARRERDAAIRERESLREQLESVACRAATAETALEAALATSGNSEGNLDGSPAASGASNSPAEPKSSEPDAWGVMRNGKLDAVTYLLRGSAELAVEGWGGTVVPLYTAPPPACGWLTEEEREAVADAAETLALRGCGSERRSRILQSLLARSSPPEVVLPPYLRMQFYGQVNREIRAALAAAGVPVKEAVK